MGAAEAEEFGRRRRRPHHIGTEGREQRIQIALLESGDDAEHQILVGQFLVHQTIQALHGGRSIPAGKKKNGEWNI
jgi:hypothetical protein